MIDLDDGATEEVQRNPSRPDLMPIDAEAITRSPAGGGISRMTNLSKAASSEFIILGRDHRDALSPVLR